MSVGVGNGAGIHVNGKSKDSYGIPAGGREARNTDGEKKADATPRGGNGKHTVFNGVRVPVLQDIEHKYISNANPTSCRFDIIEKVKTVIKPGSFGPSDARVEYNDTKVKSPRPTMEAVDQKLAMSRSNTFHSFSASDQNVMDKISPYHWSKWVKSGKESDARDVLYRNTYCRGNLRFRTLTLPRISQERPVTVGGDGSNLTKSDDSFHVISPQQQRGTVVRFREYMKEFTHASDDKAIEIKRYKTGAYQPNHFATMQNELPLIRLDSRKSSKKSERPMKFEDSKYARQTLFNKQIQQNYKTAFDRDYSSADTFKEYLETLQANGTARPLGTFITDRKAIHEARQSIDYHNQALQTVKAVNQPEGGNAGDTSGEQTRNPDNRAITVEIKSSWQEHPEEGGTEHVDTTDGKTGVKTIDNLSSVQGSVIKAHSEGHTVNPISSSMVNGESAANANQSNGENKKGALPPTNTPTPSED